MEDGMEEVYWHRMGLINFCIVLIRRIEHPSSSSSSSDGSDDVRLFVNPLRLWLTPSFDVCLEPGLQCGGGSGRRWSGSASRNCEPRTLTTTPTACSTCIQVSFSSIYHAYRPLDTPVFTIHLHISTDLEPQIHHVNVRPHFSPNHYLSPRI